MRYQFRWGAEVSAMSKDAHEDAGFEELFDDGIVLTRLCALVLRSDHFTGDFIRPLEIVG